MKDIKIISYYTGFSVIGVALLMLIPMMVSLLADEMSVLLDFVISISISLTLGILLLSVSRGEVNKSQLEWRHGLIIAAFSWILLMILCAVPYWLSGHCRSFLDACFDVMSGFTTTGLSLLQDLDHISLGLNMWRHIVTFVGGQGIIVLALTFLFRETGGAYKLYVGEAKDIEIVPNVKGTARIIWKISIIYLLIGTFVLWICGMLIGLSPISALLHGIFIFAAGWSTGGFAPMSQNMLYYHSLSYEALAMVFFILGSLNFGLHYAVLNGKKKEIIKNIEMQSFYITAFLISFLTALSISKLGLYSGSISMFRKVIYHVISAHTTTGFATVYPRQFALEWGEAGLVMLIIAMLIGGSACSTAGGIKGLRIAVVFRGIFVDTRRLLSTERRVSVFKIHHLKDVVLEDSMVKTSSLIMICFLTLFLTETLAGMCFGYPLLDSAFEAASITGNVGLSAGITTADMPDMLKICYIFGMYLGRLEFISVFAFIGYVLGGARKICQKCLNV